MTQLPSGFTKWCLFTNVLPHHVQVLMVTCPDVQYVHAKPKCEVSLSLLGRHTNLYTENLKCGKSHTPTRGGQIRGSTSSLSCSYIILNPPAALKKNSKVEPSDFLVESAFLTSFLKANKKGYISKRLTENTLL